MSRRTAPDARARRGRRHLELAPEIDEWPDDLLTLLGQARQGYLAAEPTPQPSPAVAAFMQVPAHGITEPVASRTPAPVELHGEPEEIELSLLASSPSSSTPHVRRPLVALGGAAAAIVLVALGLRPMLGVSAAEAEPTTSTASQPTTSSVLDGDRDGPTTPTTAPPTTVPPAPVPAPIEPAPTPPAAATTPSLPKAPATTAKSSGTSTKKPAAAPSKSGSTPAPAAAPAPAAPPTLAPAVGTSTREAVLRYYDLANTRGKCVAKQPKGATRAQLIAACGPEPVPPANLVQYWAAKDTWGRCADPLLAKGWSLSKVEGTCGAKPDRATYDVPPNPYS